MSRASDALALARAVAREEAYAARGTGSALVVEAAKAAQPARHALRCATLVELEAMRDTATGKRFGVQAAQVSRDGRVAVLVLGEPSEGGQ